jgi:uncharacterized protein (DUF433 family)
MCDVIESFGIELVEKITGLTHRQLRHLDALDVLRPSVAPWEPQWPPLYSFQDLKKLRVVALALQLDMDAPSMRKLMNDLEAEGIEDPLTTVRLVGDVDEHGRLIGRAFVEHPMTGDLRSARHLEQHAQVYDLKMLDLHTDLIGTIEQLTKRTVTGSVERRRGVQGNQPVVVGTRIPTRLVARLAREGWSSGRIRESYPILSDDDIRAALDHEGVSAAEAVA